MRTRRIRAGIVGAGFVGPLHLEALRRLGFVDVVCLAAETKELAQAAAAKLGVERAYDDYRQLLADDSIEVVHNCTPNRLHFEINRLAINAGKHIISEKPLAMNTRESGELLAMLDDRPLVHAVNFVHRGYPLVQQVREMVRAGELGRISLVHGSYLQDWLLLETDYNWRIDPTQGGMSRALADIGSHWLDLLEFVTGSHIVEVCADLKTVLPRRRRSRLALPTFQSTGSERDCEIVDVTTEDYAALLFRFADGASGTMLVSQVSAGRKNRLWFEVDGSRRALAWDSERPDELWIGHRERMNGTLLRDPALLAPTAASYVRLPGGHPEGWQDALKNLLGRVYSFIAEERSPRIDEPGFPTFHDGHRAITLVEAAMQSAREGKWIQVTR